MAAAALVLAALTGCSEAQLATHIFKSAQQPPLPARKGAVKVGDPYLVNGNLYVPRVEPAYDRVGVASWYGPDFHGRRTANGDVFDMNALTAAHPTLPMPSTVRVTNLENGRSLLLVVNDRGPFVGGRLIDVSRRAAQLLGFYGQGTARVRVQVINGPAPAPAMSTAQATQPVQAAPPMPKPAAVRPPIAQLAAAEPPVRMRPIPPPAALRSALPVAAPAPVPVPARVAPPAWFIQGGAFRDNDNAAALGRRLSLYGPVRIKPVAGDGGVLYRVQLGPVYDMTYAERLLHRVVAAGHGDARLVLD